MTTLVLLPGLDGTGDLFEALRTQLSPTIAVRVLSYPGDAMLDHGQLADLVMAQLPRRGPFALLGESFSGPVAAAVAARCAPTALVLACSFVHSPHPRLRALAPLLAWLPRPSRLIGPLSWALMGRDATPEWRGALAQALERVDPAVLRFRAGLALRADARAHLAAVTCPVLYLQATRDRVIRPRCAQDVLRAQPRTVVVPIAGPHFLLQTKAAEAARAIEAFLGSMGPRTGRDQ